MKRKDKGIYHHLRLSKNNPEHMKIHNILMDLNKDIYKSKNQFIVEALLFYIAELEEHPLTGSRQQSEREKDKLITKGEMDDIATAMKNELMQYINKEVLVTIISALGNNLGNSRVVVTGSDDNTNDNHEEQVDERLIELASSWS